MGRCNVPTPNRALVRRCDHRLERRRPRGVPCHYQRPGLVRGRRTVSAFPAALLYRGVRTTLYMEKGDDHAMAATTHSRRARPGFAALSAHRLGDTVGSWYARSA